MAKLSNIRVAVLATDGFEEAELIEPLQALRDAGAHADVISPKSGQIQAFRHLDKGIMVDVDRTFDKAKSDEYDAMLLPGGALNADAMRVDPHVQAFIKSMADKPMAAICHAPWELISVGVARGKTMTSYHTIQDDIRNAGANWVDEEVRVDGNLVTSRDPHDIPAFNHAMIELFSKVPANAGR